MKLKLISMALLMFAFFSTAAVYANENIGVTVDGQRVNFTGQPPVMVEGRTLVPVRGVFEQMGFEVDWDDATRRITLKNSRYTIILTIGSNAFTANGVRRALDVPPQIINGTTMLPIRSVLESVGYQLDWNPRGAGIVIITALPTQQSSASDIIASPTSQQPSAPPIPSGWRTIDGPAGLRLTAPSAWERDEADKRVIRVILEEFITMSAARTDESYLATKIQGGEGIPEHLITPDMRAKAAAFGVDLDNPDPSHRVISQQSFLFDDGTVGVAAERAYDITWISEKASISFYFTIQGCFETGYTWDKTFFYENEDIITAVARSLTVIE